MFERLHREVVDHRSLLAATVLGRRPFQLLSGVRRSTAVGVKEAAKLEMVRQPPGFCRRIARGRRTVYQSPIGSG